MELQSPESAPQKEKRKETILPPAIIRPLGRALKQHFAPRIKAIRKLVKQLEDIGAFSPEYTGLVKKGIDGFNDNLQKLEKAKEVKLIEDVPDDPQDPSIFGFEFSEELEKKITIPRSITVIEKPFLPALGIAIQDALVGAVISVRRPLSSFPDSSKESVEEIRIESGLIFTVLNNLSHASKITIVNTAKKSTIESFQR